MERFTEKFRDGRNIIREGIAYVEHGSDRFFDGEAVDKLAEYEDLEEQGYLIRIPCKIGDTIYVIPSEVNYKINIVNRHEELNHVYKQVVSSVGPSKCGYIIYTCDNQSLVLDEEYKETWFLTEEEAKAALRRMEEKNETN